MKYFWPYIFLYLILALGAVAGLTVCLAHGRVSWAIVCGIAGACAVYALFGRIRKLTGSMCSFANALEIEDTTFRMPSDTSDAEMRRLAEGMNRIMDTHRADRLAMETRKLYYDRILRVMTHEMRNSIAPVIALSDDMHKHPERYDEASRSEAIGVIYAQSEGIRRFLEAYRTLTHLPSPALTSVRAAAFFSEIKMAFDSRCASKELPAGMVSYTVPVDLQLCIDVGLMRQAIGNLINNAIDAVASSDRPAVKVVVSQSGGRPTISVSDNGNGISQAVLPDIFQPFITDKADGTGIGLCLSRQIVMLHGGELRLVSTGSHGTTFVITLP